MEQARYGNLTLEAAGPVLARSAAARATVRNTLNGPDVSVALAMLKSGSLVGDLGAAVHDHLADAIGNESRVVWEGNPPVFQGAQK